MIFFDTNVLVYCIIPQNSEKQEKAIAVVERALLDNEFTISPLVLSELVYVLSKLNADESLLFQNIELYSRFISHEISADIVWDAFKASHLHNDTKHINDIIHIKYAERYCTKIFTFDKGYEKFKNYADVEVIIL
jgi:predicted nucleic acid-binding protein